MKKNAKKMHVVGVLRSYYTHYIVEAASEEEAESVAFEMANEWDILEEPDVIDISTDVDVIEPDSDVLVILDKEGNPYAIKGALTLYLSDDDEANVPDVKTLPDGDVIRYLRGVFLREARPDNTVSALFNLIQRLFFLGIAPELAETVALNIGKHHGLTTEAHLFLTWCTTRVEPNGKARSLYERTINTKF